MSNPTQREEFETRISARNELAINKINLEPCGCGKGPFHYLEADTQFQFDMWLWSANLGEERLREEIASRLETGCTSSNAPDAKLARAIRAIKLSRERE